MADYDDLLAKARAATPGPWRNDGDCIGVHLTEAPWHRVVVGIEETGTTYNPWRELRLAPADAEYIAAVSPDVVIAIVERLREAERALTREVEGNYAHFDALRAANIEFARQRNTYRQDSINSERKRDAAEKRAEAAEARLQRAVEALRLAQRELDEIAGYSGSAGNWPLQDAVIAVRAALAEIDR